MTKKRIDKEYADLAYWTAIFKHMPGWEVVGWTFRNSCQVLYPIGGNRGKSLSYDSVSVQPIEALIRRNRAHEKTIKNLRLSKSKSGHFTSVHRPRATDHASRSFTNAGL